jgi:hypothetical protein
MRHLYYSNNQLVSLKGTENLVNLIKNNKQIKNNMECNFIELI